MDRLRSGDPREVGPYRLEGRLGAGGMGQVFLGRSRGGRPVAVKVVRPELADDPGFRRRFALEVEAARRVGGFYTAQVVDAGPDADPPWLVTAYIPGPSLHEAVERHGPLPVSTITVLGTGLAEGLAAVHGCGLVHRDLKPSNVIIAEDGPRVIDFGIARALDATSHTATQAVIGTPSFMSPEQARGGDVGTPSDVFSLAAVLVFAATGRGPFGTGPAQAVLYRVVHDEPDIAGVPPQVKDLLASCLAKEPRDRPSVAGLLDRLDRLAVPDRTATRWLPRDVSTMIDERGTATLTMTSDRPETGPGASEERATLRVGNLGRGDIDVVLDGDSLGRIGTGGLGTFHVAPGGHSVQVRNGPHGSALRRVETQAGGTLSMAFDDRSGAVPEPVDEMVLAEDRTRTAAKAFTVWTSFSTALGFLIVLGAFLTNKDANVAWSEVTTFIMLASVGGGVLFGLMALASRPVRLTVRPDGLTFEPGPRNVAATVGWNDLQQVSVIGGGRDAKLVVWYREGRRPPGRRADLQGGTIVCATRTFIGGQDLGRLRAGLAWFAGDLHVHQPS